MDHSSDKFLLFYDFEDEDYKAKTIAKVSEEKVTPTTIDVPKAITTIVEELPTTTPVLPTKEIEATEKLPATTPVLSTKEIEATAATVLPEADTPITIRFLNFIV